MSIALARYLKDFSEPQSAVSAMPMGGFAGADADLHDHVFLAADEPDPVDIDSERREAYADGHETATRDLGAEHEAALAALHASHQAEIDALRKHFEEDAATLLAARIEEIASAVALAVSDQTAEILAPVMSDILAEKAVATMAEMLKRSILDGSAGRIIVKGPRTLYDLLMTRLGDSASVLRYVEMPDLDLSVDIDDTVLVTRLSAWSASVKKVLE